MVFPMMVTLQFRKAFTKCSWISQTAAQFTNFIILPRADAVALIYGTSLRNLSISLAIAVNAFGKTGTGAALVLAAAFIVQTQVATWSTKFIDRIFGSAIDTRSQESGTGKKNRHLKTVH